MLGLGDVGRHRGEHKISLSYTNQLASYAVKRIFMVTSSRKCPVFSKIPQKMPKSATRAKFKSKGPIVYLCYINQCPIDIILRIAEYLRMRDLYAFLRTSRDFYAVIGIPFYDRAIKHRCLLDPTVIEWAARKDRPTLIQKFQTPRKREAFSTDTKNKSLAIAAIHGHASTIVPLLELGAEVSSTAYACREWFACPTRRYTPLHYAAQGGNLDALELLLDHGADSEAVSCKGETALVCAVENNRKACVRVLVEKGTNLRFEAPLGRAIEKYNRSMVRLLLELGANPSSPGPGGCTPCFSAMMKSQLPIMEVLLEKGADPECAYHGWSKTLLHHAVEHGKTQAIHLLLKYHASLSATDGNGLQPLHYAAGGWQFEPQSGIALLLLDEGAEMSRTDRFGFTALDYGLCSGDESTIEIMMQDQAQQSLCEVG